MSENGEAEDQHACLEDAIVAGNEDIAVVLGFTAIVKYLDHDGDMSIALSSNGVADWEAVGMLRWGERIVDRNMAWSEDENG